MRARPRLFLDLALAAGLLLAFYPKWTGIPVHQWLSIAIIGPLALHFIVNWEWALRVARKFFAKLFSASRANFVVDCALMVSTVAVMLSGFMVSPQLLAPLGIHVTWTYSWHVVHLWSANATVALLVLHGALHWRWALGVARRMVAPPERPEGRLTPALAVAAGSSPADHRRERARERARKAAAERATALRGISAAAFTGAVGVAVFASVMLANPLLAAGRPHPKSTVRIAKGQLVCPDTGCVASRCHATSGAPARSFYTAAERTAGLKGARPSSARVRVASSSGMGQEPLAALATFPRPGSRVRSKALPKPKQVAAAPKKSAASSGSGGGSSPSAPAATSQTASVQTCPSTGCTASSCHGAHGVSASVWYASH